MAANRFWRAIKIIAIALQLFSEILLFYFVCKINVLTVPLTAALAAFLILLFVITCLIAFAGRKKAASKGRAIRGIIAVVIAIITVILCSIACFTLSAAARTISSVTANDEATHTIGVYVLADDPAESIQDAADYSFAYLGGLDSSNYTAQTISAIESEIGHKPDTAAYEDAVSMVDALYSQDIQAIILDEAFVSIIEDQPDYEDYSTRTRLIYECTYSVAARNSESADKSITQEPFVLYLSGSDTRSRMLDVSRSDVNILAVVNPKTKQVLLVNTPRDYYVPISISSSGTRDKLTHCGIYGIDCSMDTLAALYGVDIDYYGQINFTGFENLIDAVGGVTVYSDTAFSASSHNFVVGDNYMDGKTALVFARDRHHQASGDNARGVHQMAVIKALIQKMSAGTIIQHYSDILSSVEGMFVTSVSSDEISQLIKMQLSDMAHWDVHSFAVTGTGGSNKTYSMPGLFCYVMYPNEDTVSYASVLMNRVINGETLTDADMNFTN